MAAACRAGSSGCNLIARYNLQAFAARVSLLVAGKNHLKCPCFVKALRAHKACELLSAHIGAVAPQTGVHAAAPTTSACGRICQPTENSPVCGSYEKFYAPHS